MSLLEIIAGLPNDWDKLPKVVINNQDVESEFCYVCENEGRQVQATCNIEAVVTGYQLNDSRYNSDDLLESANSEPTNEGRAYYLYQQIVDYSTRPTCGEHTRICEWCSEGYGLMLRADNGWDVSLRHRYNNVPWAMNLTSWSWDDTLCLDCAKHAQSCDRCQDLINLDDGTHSDVDGNPWCESCVDWHASFCEECDVYHSDGPCGGWDDDRVRDIHDYSYKPDARFGFLDSDASDYSVKVPITGRSRVPFMGFELEVEAGRASIVDGVETIKQFLGDDEGYVYIKGDGSLNCGFEIVSHPCTLAGHKTMKLAETLKGLSDLGFRSWRTDTCGLHVHVSRAGFSSPSHVWKFTHFIVDNRQAMVKLAGRNSERWANFNLEGYNNGGIKNRAKGYSHYNRYEAINFQNTRTLELRFFKGSLKVERVLSALELTEGAVEYTRNLTSRDVMSGGLDFCSFVTWLRERADKYPNLLSYVDTLGIAEYQTAKASWQEVQSMDVF
jgi:hypothetical protein